MQTYALSYKTIYKVLPCAVELWRYSCAKKEHRFFSKLLALINNIIKVAIFIVT